jgi:hypothetical protein
VLEPVGAGGGGGDTHNRMMVSGLLVSGGAPTMEGFPGANRDRRKSRWWRLVAERGGQRPGRRNESRNNAI